MKLSVILPTYNQEKFLGRCLDSLLNQGLKRSEYEIIIVNDGSTDNTLDVAQHYTRKHSNIKVVNRDNGGAGAARNTGMTEAKGKYLHFVDPDDYLSPGVYEPLLHEMETKDLDILGFGYKKVFSKPHDLKSLSQNGNTNAFQKSDPGTPDRNLPLKAVKNADLRIYDGIEFLGKFKHQSEVWWFLVSSEFLKNNDFRFMEGRWMEDVLLTPQLLLKAGKVAKSDLDVYNYYISSDSAMQRKTDDEHYIRIIKDIENAAIEFDSIIRSIPVEHPKGKECKRKLRIKQESLVFFMIIRFCKSNLELSWLTSNMNALKAANAFPLRNFISEDFNQPSYKLLTFFFNRPLLFKPTLLFLRLYFKPKYFFNHNSLGRIFGKYHSYTVN